MLTSLYCFDERPKFVLLLLIVMSLFLALSCTKDDPCDTTVCFNGGICIEGTCDCPPGYAGVDCLSEIIAEGEVVFYVEEDCECGFIDIVVGGLNGTISSISSNPSCDDLFALSFSLDEGVYNYFASCSGKSWNSSVAISENNCTRVELNCDNTTGSNNGEVVFYQMTECGSVQFDGPVTVDILGVKKSIYFFHPNGADCNSPSTVVYDLPAGLYSYSASNDVGTWAGQVNISSGNCSRIELECNQENNDGDVVFYATEDCGCEPITVIVNGQSRTISSSFNGAPNCGANGAATFTLPATQTYSMSASCSNQNWSGSVAVSAGSCSSYELTCSQNMSKQMMFWIDRDCNCGPITVQVGGVSRVIDSFYQNGPPNCGASGCATFDLQNGTYSYRADCNGFYWESSVTVTNSCNTHRLNCN